MTSEIKLFYPTIDIFLYDLCEGLGDNSKTIDENRAEFWKRIYQRELSSQELEKFVLAEQEESNYIELLGNQRDEEFKNPYDGFYFPLKLGDTYALQVDCSGFRKWKGKSQSIDCFAEIQEITLNHRGEVGQLGESWLISLKTYRIVSSNLLSIYTHYKKILRKP
ncbi:MAG: hypothetical protein AB4290_05035 [Spirulina sp.]